MTRRIRMEAAGSVVSLLLVVAVAGCGNQEQSYCDAIGQHQKMFAELIDNNDAAGLIDNLAAFKHLAGAAPDDLTDEWQTFVSAIEELSEALHDAGVKPSAFQGGKPPAGLSASSRRSIADAADRLTSPQVLEAVNGIDQQARDVCHTNLGL